MPWAHRNFRLPIARRNFLRSLQLARHSPASAGRRLAFSRLFLRSLRLGVDPVLNQAEDFLIFENGINRRQLVLGVERV
jgi:hypothetical protein